MNPAIVSAARAIRSARPWIALSDALTYADPTTVQHRAFYSSGEGYKGTGFDRDTLAFALAWYDRDYCPTGYGAIVHRLQVRTIDRFSDEDSEVKRAYGAIVCAHRALWTGFDRYVRRARKAGRSVPMWPGFYNMRSKGSERATLRAWLDSHGILAACETLAPSEDETADAIIAACETLDECTDDCEADA